MNKKSVLPDAKKMSPSFVVTGFPRSGTTFTGTIMGCSSRVRVLFEPFHTVSGVKSWPAWPYMEDKEEVVAFQCEYADILRRPKRYRPRPNIARKRRLLHAVVGHNLQRANNLSVLRGLPPEGMWCVKDPHLCLIPGVLHSQLGIPTVIMRRHPGAIAASWKRLGWNPRYQDIFASPALRARISNFPLEEWTRGTLMERVVGFYVIARYLEDRALEEYPGLILVHHHELSMRPVTEFRRVFDALGLPWEEKVEATICEMTTGDVAVLDSNKAHYFHRDSKSIPEAWRSQLTDEETAFVKNTVVRHLGEDAWE